MDEENIKPPCEFDRLFTTSVPYVLQKIFFSLDYDSFMKTREVCKAWNELHSSKSYRRAAENMLKEKKRNEERLCNFSMHGNYKEVSQLLSNGVDPNCELSVDHGSWGGRTPLCRAALYGHKDVAELLINSGADPDKPEFHGSPLLHWAADAHRMDTVKILLGAGADPNRVDNKGQPPLHVAARMGNAGAVKILLEGGADPNKANANNGATPLQEAGNSLVRILLINAGADPIKVENNGATCCHNRKVIKLLRKRVPESEKANKRAKK